MFVEVCEAQREELLCADDQRVRMDLVFFGRHSNDTCSHPTVTDDVSCPSPVGLFSRVESICGGRQQCWFEALVQLWGDPCPGISKQGHVEYTCQSE